MARSVGSHIRRGVGILIGAVVILGIGVYGPATLIGPLPSATASIDTVADVAPSLGAPTLPSGGASAIVAADTDVVLAKAGDEAAVPLGGATKLITALVVLDAKPIAPGLAGPSITVTAEDYASFSTYISEFARSVSFLPGEVWSERSYLQALLLGSSNNHADALARWAFGSVDAYVTAANTWLAANGFAGTTVVDATGLAEGSVGTASDLARLSQRAFANSVIAEIMPAASVTLPGNRTVNNLARYRAADGITGLSLSYTDQAGLTFLFQATVASGTKAVILTGAFLRQPDYDTLNADLTTLVTSAAANLTQTTIVTEGDAFATYTTPWGQTARAVAATSESRLLWLTQPVSHTVTIEPLIVGTPGTTVGTVVFQTQSGDISVPLLLQTRLTDPGPLWRLGNPFPVIGAFIDSRRG